MYAIGVTFTQGHNLTQARVSPPADKSGNLPPVTSFVLLERYNAVKTVQHVHGSLAKLSKVIRGQQLLTSDVQTLASALINLEVCALFCHQGVIILFEFSLL